MSDSVSRSDVTKHSSGKRRSRWLLIGAVVTVLLVGGVTIWDYGRNASWWGTSDTMRVLLDDPLASPDLLKLTLVGSDQSRPAGPFGKPRPDFASHWYKPPNEDLAGTARELSTMP